MALLDYPRLYHTYHLRGYLSIQELKTQFSVCRADNVTASRRPTWTTRLALGPFGDKTAGRLTGTHRARAGFPPRLSGSCLCVRRHLLVLASGAATQVGYRLGNNIDSAHCYPIDIDRLCTYSSRQVSHVNEHFLS